MTYKELTALPATIEDGDIFIDCNFSCQYGEGKEIDFQGHAVTLKSCNMFNTIPVNADNVTLDDTPSFNRESTPDDSEPVDPVQREVDTITARLAEIAVDSPDIVAASIAAESDALPMDSINTAISMKPAPIEKVRG
jgi:hypothetical protein